MRRPVPRGTGRGTSREQPYGQPVVTVPKTRASLRLVALDPGTVAVLRRHRLRQRPERLAAGRAYADSGLVLPRLDGTPVNSTDQVAVPPTSP